MLYPATVSNNSGATADRIYAYSCTYNYSHQASQTQWNAVYDDYNEVS